MKDSCVNNVPGQGDRPAGTCYIRLGNINFCCNLDGVVIQHRRSKEKTVCTNSFKVVIILDLQVVDVMLADKWIEAVQSVKY